MLSTVSVFLLLKRVIELQSGDKATVLCFVEFIEARYAQAAMEALQGIVQPISLCMESG